MPKLALTIILLAGVLAGLEPPHFSGYLQNWTAVPLQPDRELYLVRNRFQLNTTLRGEWARGFASLDLRDDLSGEKSVPELTLRECYLDLYFERLDLRIGKQQVVWGKADGVFINDIVNPLDLRFFLMQDFEDIRLGTPLTKANLYWHSWGLELLYIPRFTPWQFAPEDSPWAFHTPDTLFIPIFSRLVPAVPVLTSELPAGTLENGEFGGRLSTHLLGTDLSVLFLNSFQDQPVAALDSIEPFNPLDPNLVLRGHFRQVYRRVTMTGLNFSRPLGSLVLRGEWGYFNGYHFNRLAIPDSTFRLPSMIYTSDYLQAMLGLDLSGPWGSNLSGQYIRKQVLDYDPLSQQVEEVEELWTLMISGTFWNETGQLRALILYDQNHDSGLSRIMFGYSLADAVALEVGLDLLWGKPQSFIGQFEENDNLYFKLKISF